MKTRTSLMRRRVLALAAAVSLGGCALGPQYQTPAVDTPAAFKEGEGGWIHAAPADALERGPWWELFEDPVLNDLAARIEVNNQNVAAAVAAYAQARALTAVQRASLFPVVSADAQASRSGGHSVPTRNSYQVGIGASWEPDVWGRLRLGVEGARAAEQASQADLAAAKLSAQGELAVDYLGLRGADVQHSSLVETVAGYQRSLEIANNRYNAGVAKHTDVLQAQTQLANAQADLLTLDRQRAQLEHAIAVLIGKPPAEFTLPADAAWHVRVPDVPVVVPSTLLQRRPDIASSERHVAQANAQIGIAEAAYFPNISLSASGHLSALQASDLFHASSLVWAVGASLAQTIFDAGATHARVQAAQAGLDQSAAHYRQTVLGAFQQVEDQLVALRILEQQQVLRQQAWDAAQLAEQQVLNSYRSGLVSYTEVVTAQVSAATAQRALVQAQTDRQVAAVSLVQALGGGWKGLQ